jgi:hypothetical protein
MEFRSEVYGRHHYFGANLGKFFLINSLRLTFSFRLMYCDLEREHRSVRLKSKCN